MTNEEADMRNSKIRFGIMADIHQDFMYKAEERLATFIARMNDENVDFIIQLGDFCFPFPNNKSFLSIWEQFNGPRYHVLGNHDMDRSTKKGMMDFLGIEKNYYSFDCGNYHFIVLDPNYLSIDGQDIDYEHGNYFNYPDSINNLPDEQLEWLKADWQIQTITRLFLATKV